MIGQRILHYEILEKLGGGGMGVVYKAEDTKLQRSVALKFLPPEWSEDELAKERFLREARMAAAFDHSNICTIHEIGETDDGRLFIAMACYPGETLKKKVERGPLDVDEAVNVAVRIAEGLDKAHRSGIVHRDIKPANVMVTDDDGVKILDFGLAKLAEGGSRLTAAGTTLGTAAYMSPEQARGEEVDARTDVWSLGIVLYEMITGELPFRGGNLVSLLRAIETDEPEPLSVWRRNQPERLEQTVSRALAKNPGARYQTAGEMLLDLRSLRTGTVETVKAADAEGSVQRAAGEVRITVQLIEARSDRHLWTESYDRPLRNVLSLQSEVARAIASEIEIQLTPEEVERLAAERPVNTEAYDLYLKGRFYWNNFTPDNLNRAFEHFELALAKDPDFAPTHLGLADVWGARTMWGGVPPKVGMPKVAAAVLKGLALDDTSSEAHSGVGKVRFYSDHDWPGAEKAFLRAIELNPSDAFARIDHALLLGSLKRFDAAVAQAKRGIEIDPLNPLLRAVLGYTYVFADRPDEAIVELRTALAGDPNLLPALKALWNALRHQQSNEEARATAEKLFSLMGDVEVVAALERGDSYTAAMHLAAETMAEREVVKAILVARLYAHAEDDEKTMEWLERSYEDRDPFLVHLAVEPDWDALRSDPRFRDLMERMGLPE